MKPIDDNRHTQDRNERTRALRSRGVSSSCGSERMMRWTLRAATILVVILSASNLRAETPGLDEMVLLRRGSRLSVQPVTPAEFKIVLKLGGRDGQSAGALSCKRGRSDEGRGG